MQIPWNLKTIVISSAKCRAELPGRCRFQKTIPLNKIIPKGMTKWGAKIIAPLVEPARKQDKESYDRSIIHIHGDKDHTLPNRMVYFRGEEVSRLINEILR